MNACGSPCGQRFPAVATLLVWIMLAVRGFATTIDPLTWEELVTGADLLGVVECETAGGIVARYKVIDSWKGPETGREVMIRTAVNAWEPQFPIALCGERFLIAAYKRPPSTMMSTTGYGPVPLWWRNIPADYETPLFQGVSRLPLQGRSGLRSFGSESVSLDEFKKSALALLQMTPEKQEAQLLRAQLAKYLWRMASDPEQDGKRKERLDTIRKRIEEAVDAKEVVEVLIDVARAEDDRITRVIAAALSRGGGPVTLRAVENLPKDGPLVRERGQITRSIQSRLKAQSETDDPDPRTEEKAPTDDVLQKLRARLKDAKPEDRDIGEAITVLSVHDPAAVAEYLVGWVNPNKDWWDHDSGYPLGSFFAWRCGKDRESHLRKLLSAKDPWIRVAGAVYLCFENREAGMRELREQQKLEGDPGAWAALNLARRGEKSAMERALEVFGTPGESNMAGVPHRNLQKRLVVLLSNTAKQSGLPLLIPGTDSGEETEFYKAWWREHAERATPFDPWLEILEKQKVD